MKITVEKLDDINFIMSGTVGGDEDALVTDENSTRGNQSAEVEGTVTDLLMLMGDKTTGSYYVQAKYYIESDYAGYINIQHFESPGIEWAHEIYFSATNLKGDYNGFMWAGSADSVYITFPYDQWMTMSWNVDLDEDWVEFYLDGEMQHEWQFSLQAQGEPGTKQLGAFDIYAGSIAGQPIHYYFDEIGFAVLQAGSVEPIP